MSLSMYHASVPVFLNQINALSGVLKKGVAYAEAKKIDPSVLLNTRLFPDMHPLTRQVQMVSDSAKGASARLAGVEPPSMPDTETTFDQLQARLTKTADFLKSLKQTQFDGAEEREVVLTLPNGKIPFKGRDYLFSFALPNFLFHVTTAYNILRHSGVELGKRDFLGAPG
jgi:uncharacterized protein